MIRIKRTRSYKTVACCLLPSGIVTLCMAIIVGYLVIPYKIWEGVMEASKLIQGDNPRYNAWAKVPIPLYYHIYLFNVTNPEKVIENGAKPDLEQLGPYIYEMKLEKFDIVFNENNGTFFYRERVDYFFRKDLSNGSESDPITSINIPYVGLAQEATKLNTFSRYFLQEIMAEHTEVELYIHTTVGHLLFQGIYLPFMKELSDLKGDSILPNNTFGIMYGQNGTNQGLFEIYSGQKHPDKFGDIVSWNRNTEFKWWLDDEFCKQLNGSDGIFQPYSNRQSVYYMFMPGMCRSFPFTFEHDNSEVFGVPVYKYSVPKSFLQNPDDNPENGCYFSMLNKPYPTSGVFPMRGCQKGPMMLSQPHFYQASSVYLNQSNGLSPDKEKHEMSIFMEPYTGTPFRVHVRFQMNVDLRPIKYFKPLKKIPKMVHPVFWVDQSSSIPKNDADTIRNSLVKALQIISIVTQSVVFIAAILILISLILFMYQCSLHSDNNDSKTKPKKGLLYVLFHLHERSGHSMDEKGNMSSKVTTLPVYSDSEKSLMYSVPTSNKLVLAPFKNMNENGDCVVSEEMIPFCKPVEIKCDENEEFLNK